MAGVWIFSGNTQWPLLECMEIIIGSLPISHFFALLTSVWLVAALHLLDGVCSWVSRICQAWEQSPSRSWLPIVQDHGCSRHPASTCNTLANISYKNDWRGRVGGGVMGHQSCLLVPENKNLETLPDYKLLTIHKSEQLLRMVKERNTECNTFCNISFTC